MVGKGSEWTQGKVRCSKVANGRDGRVDTKELVEVLVLNYPHRSPLDTTFKGNELHDNS